MRLGLITPGFRASEDDWCVPALSDLAGVLAERDEVTVFALRYPHRRRAYRVCGATVHPTGGAQRAGLARLPIMTRTLARVLREARRRPFDAIGAWWAHEPGFVAAVAGRLTRTPVLVSVLGGELVDLPEIDYGGGRSRVNRWLVARSLAAAGGVTVGSESLRRLAERSVPGGRLGREPLGVDLERFTPAPRSPSGPRLGGPRLDGDPALLQVASLVPVKDQRSLLVAFARVVAQIPGARLHLVGDGELAGELDATARQLGLEDRVRFHGAVDHASLPAVYRQADLLIQSSLFEAQGMAVLEAAACGCPVAGTSVGVLPELCGDQSAALIAPGDAGALAEAVLAMLDADRRDRLARTQAAAVRRFELRAVAARWRRRFDML